METDLGLKSHRKDCRSGELILRPLDLQFCILSTTLQPLLPLLKEKLTGSHKSTLNYMCEIRLSVILIEA